MLARRLLLTACALLLLLYVGAYLALSRQGYAVADQYGLDGFYYVVPENTDAWRATNRSCELLFMPLNWIDCSLGSGRPPAFEPLWITP